jgi:hypothetical protein
MACLVGKQANSALKENVNIKVALLLLMAILNIQKE